MNWLNKTARRRFKDGDSVRYLTGPGNGSRKVVFAPPFSKGRIVSFDPASRRYRVRSDGGEISDVHPRNMMYDNQNGGANKDTVSETTNTHQPIEIEEDHSWIWER